MKTLILVGAAVALMRLGGPLRADDIPTQPKTTTITVPDMHCLGCAKKMANQLYQVSGVAEVKVSVETTTMIISPKAQTAPSPHALWEAIEKAGYKPTKIVGPSGTFSAKPKS